MVRSDLSGIDKMIKRCCALFFLSTVLLSCGEKAEDKSVAIRPEPESQDSLPPVISENNEQKISTVPPVAETGVKKQPVLDLSLPGDLQGDVQDWEEEKSRYGAEDWFEQTGQSEEQRLKIKTKLRMKEGAEFDRNSSFSSYSESVDGAEMGFEYKTR